MAKVSRRARFNAPPSKSPGAAILIGKGVLVSLTISILCTIFLSIISLITENVFIENYLTYVMVAITITSIFIGSVYSTLKAESMGLIIGMAIGFIYVLFSIGIGMQLATEPISWLMIANKITAGLAAGALGGFVGVNLQ